VRRVFYLVIGLLLAMPVAIWGWYHERRILRLGRELTEGELADARAVGVAEPQRLRVLAVGRVPNPVQWLCNVVERFTRFRFFAPGGLTLRYGVFAVKELAQDRALLAHEFVHTAQYERAGGVYRFLACYLYQCMVDGYATADWEIEACEVSARAISKGR